MEKDYNDLLFLYFEGDDQMITDHICKRIKAGEKPNKHDVATVLRDCIEADIPQTFRDYIAAMVLDKCKGTDKKTYYGQYPTIFPHLKKDADWLSFRPLYEELLKKYDKETSLRLIAMAVNLEMPLNSLDPERIEAKWKEKFGEAATSKDYDSNQKELATEMGRIDHIVNPRNRKPSSR